MSNSIKIINRETMKEEIDKIKTINSNAKFWSISKINNFNICKRGYYYTYVNKKEQQNNVYNLLGSAVHSDFEDVFENRTNRLENNHFDSEWMKINLFGINFMNDNVKDNYKKDIDAMYKYYKKPDGEFLSEIGFLLKLDENNYMQGYIDLIQLLEDGKVNITDFKTSSKFDKKKLVEAGRQLCVYQLALEQLYNMKIVDNGWLMCKYLTVKVGDYKPKDVSAREWVSKCKSQIKNLNKKEKYIDETFIDMLLYKCEIDNNISLLPKELQDRIKVETCFVKYDITEEVKEETLSYILETIKKIEKLDTDNEQEWDCNVNNFYCKNLCSFSNKYCRYWEI